MSSLFRIMVFVKGVCVGQSAELLERGYRIYRNPLPSKKLSKPIATIVYCGITKETYT